MNDVVSVSTQFVVGEVVSARGEELLDFCRRLKDKRQDQGGKRCFQRVHHSERRRAASHNPYRVPWRFRQKALADFKKAPPRKSVKPHAARQRQPANAFGPGHFGKRSARNHWSECHLWHAKRCHIEYRWGLAIPWTSNLKKSRRIFRAGHRGSSHPSAVISDVSWMATFEVYALKKTVESLLMEILQTDDSRRAVGFLLESSDGMRESRSMRFYSNGKVMGTFRMRVLERGDQHVFVFIQTHPRDAESFQAAVERSNVKLKTDWQGDRLRWVGASCQLEGEALPKGSCRRVFDVTSFEVIGRPAVSFIARLLSVGLETLQDAAEGDVFYSHQELPVILGPRPAEWRRSTPKPQPDVSPDVELQAKEAFLSGRSTLVAPGNLRRAPDQRSKRRKSAAVWIPNLEAAVQAMKDIKEVHACGSSPDDARAVLKKRKAKKDSEEASIPISIVITRKRAGGIVHGWRSPIADLIIMIQGPRGLGMKNLWTIMERERGIPAAYEERARLFQQARIFDGTIDCPGFVAQLRDEGVAALNQHRARPPVARVNFLLRGFPCPFFPDMESIMGKQPSVVASNLLGGEFTSGALRQAVLAALNGSEGPEMPDGLSMAVEITASPSIGGIPATNSLICLPPSAISPEAVDPHKLKVVRRCKQYVSKRGHDRVKNRSEFALPQAWLSNPLLDPGRQARSEELDALELAPVGVVTRGGSSLAHGGLGYAHGFIDARAFLLLLRRRKTRRVSETVTRAELWCNLKSVQIAVMVLSPSAEEYISMLVRLALLD